MSTASPGRATAMGPANERAAAAMASASSVRGMRWVRTRRRALAAAASRPTSAALERAPDDLLRNSLGVRGLRQEQIGGIGQFDQLLRWAAIAGVDQRTSTGADPEPEVRPRVGEQRGPHLEGSDGHLVARLQLMDHMRAGHDLRSIERQDGIERASRREHRQRRQGDLGPCPGAQERVQVGAMVRMAMAHEHGIEAGRIIGRERHRHAVAGIDQDGEAIGFQEVSAARLPTPRIPAAAPDHGQSHRRRIGMGASVDEAVARDILSVRVSAPLHAFHHALLKEFEWPWPSPPAGLSWHRAVRVSRTSPRFSPSRT